MVHDSFSTVVCGLSIGIVESTWAQIDSFPRARSSRNVAQTVRERKGKNG